MNQQNSVTHFEKVVASKLSDDGKYIQLLVEGPNNRRVEIAFALDAVPQLIQAAAKEQDRALAAQPRLPAYEAKWFAFGRDAGSGSQTLSLTVNGGGRIHFALARGMQSSMLSALKGLAGEASKKTG